MTLPYQQARFIKSVPDPAQAPPDTGCEVAFAGRSNAGKSSALNAITGTRALARVSKTPGRTQHLVFFDLGAGRRLVDLPGYGYARAGAATKRRWQQAVERYLNRRRSLRGLILVMDVRHPLTDFDHQLLGWCAHAGLAVHALLTKADKLKFGRAKAALLAVQRELESEYANVEAQLFSAAQQTGVDQVRGVLERWLGGPECEA